MNETKVIFFSKNWHSIIATALLFSVRSANKTEKSTQQQQQHLELELEL